MQGRYYDPALGRFLSVDPVGFNESNPASFNRYIYGNNNPHKYVDPDGELPLLLIYWGVSAALSAYDTYSAYQEGGIGAAAIQIALSTGGAGGKAALRGGKLLKRIVQGPKSKKIHKNSLDYVGETHVYRIKGPDGSTYKIGESAQGTKVRDGASIRAEQQAREFTRKTGDTYTSDIRKTFPDKASARKYETKLIKRFRRRYGQDSLPGNKTDR